MADITPDQLASRIEHTILKPEAMPADIHRTVTEAMRHAFAAVCVAPVWVRRVSDMLRAEASAVRVVTVAGFPHGTGKSTVKAIEATSAVKDGADEVDVVAHLPNLLRLDADAARGELLEIVRAVRAARRDAVVKVIVESALLISALGKEQGERALAAACRAVRESGCDYVKTSTGFHPAGGATVESVALMKKYADGIGVKAAGGIRDYATARAMIEAGADRLGMSASVAVMGDGGNAE